MGLASGVRGRTWRKKRKMLGEKDFGLRRRRRRRSGKWPRIMILFTGNATMRSKAEKCYTQMYHS
jgi:hypothetical protein